MVEGLLRQRRLRWFGHVCRMDNCRIPKRLLFGQLIKGKRPRHNPRRRWNDTVSADLCCLNVRHSWYTMTKDRDAWRHVSIQARNITVEPKSKASKPLTTSTPCLGKVSQSSTTTTTLIAVHNASQSLTAPVVKKKDPSTLPYLKSNIWVKFNVGKTKRWFHGVIDDFNDSTNKYHILYDDGDSEELELPTQDPDVCFSTPWIRCRPAVASTHGLAQG